MSRSTLIYLLLVIATGAAGFGNITASLAGYAQVLFVIFVPLLLISLVAGLVNQTEGEN